MELIRGTRLEHGHVVWPLRPRAPMMLFVVKATFDIQVGGEATLADEQPPCTGPLFLDDDVDRPLVYPGDFDPLKPVGECFLVGTCHPPGGGAVASEVRLEVGPVKKTVAVFGDRRFRWGVLGKGASAPERFERMPLSWERSFGGPGYGPNPWGRGFTARREGEPERQLPNLEDPRRLIDSSSARPTPAGFSPIHPAAPSRLAFAGTYDERWKTRRFPYFPTDLDPRYFLSSPTDQRAPGPWTGKERVRVTHAHPDHPELTTTLPGFAPRAFAHRFGEALDAFFEVALTCDTIVVDTDAMRITTVHRGLFEVKDSEGSDIERIFVTHDVGRKASHYECRTRYEAHLRLRDLEQNGFAPLNPSDDGDARTMMLVRAHLDELRTDPSSQATLHEAFAVPVGTGGATLAEVMLADVMPVVVVGSPEAPEATAPEAAAPEVPAVGTPGPKLAAAQVESQFGAIGEPVPPAVAAAVARDEASVPGEEAPDADAAPEADAGAGTEGEPAAEASAERSRRALALFAEGEPLRGDWSELSLQEEFLEELDAAGALLSGANFRGARLARARLAGCSLAGACLSGADLRGADLQGADLTGAKLDDALLDGATLDGATLERASLQRASLREASLLATEAPRANFNEAILEGAKADELDLSRGSLRSARAGGGSFQNARLIGVDATAAIFEGADLTKLRAYGGARFEGADLRTAKADGARFRGSSLVSAIFVGASLVRSDFRGSNLEGASLDGCALKKAKFGGANLTRTRVRGSDLMQASLTQAVLSETDFSDSNLFAAELHEAIRDRARFSGAVLTGTKWEALA